MFMVPLHAYKMSMPSTCSSHNTASTLEHAITNTVSKQSQNILLRLFSPLNITELQLLIEESIKNICIEYYNSQSTFEIDKLRAFSRTCSHVDKIGIFFLLLNIDQQMKEFIMNVDGNLNGRKLTRFFADLKLHAVPKFFSSENSTISQFVDECEDTYVIA